MLFDNKEIGLPDLFNLSFQVKRCSNMSHLLNEKDFLMSDHEVPNVLNLFYESNDHCRIGWNESGIAFELFSDSSPSEFSFLRLFFNVRKSRVYETSNKFCHIFEFKLASKAKPWMVISNKIHGNLDSKNFHSSFGAIFRMIDKNKYSMRAWIGIEALNGYDPYEFSVIGFSYSYSWDCDYKKNLSGGVDLENIKPICWSSANLKHDIV